jgi:hypothetical protein
MTILRDNFTPETKRILGSRVAFRCCFPGCGILTIGPNTIADDKFITLGEAAHIHAAAPGGPRFLKAMTVEERKAFDNGIWLCRHHAKLIDADFGNYSAETLVQWKKTMEAETYRQLKDLAKVNVPDPTTIVCLNPKLMFEGIWKGAINDTWRFIVKEFIYGDLALLREYSSTNQRPFHKYIIVESQGDGRLIQNQFEWKQDDNGLEISVNVFPPVVRRDPNHIGTDLAWEGDLVIENGDLKLVSGKALAKQIIERNLNIQLGSWWANPRLGTLFNIYYSEHKNNRELLNRIIKIELTRLITIPIKPEDPADQPELSFINRIHEVKVMEEVDGSVPVFISLEWGDGTFWADTIKVFVGDDSAQIEEEINDLPDLFKEMIDKEPIDILKRLTANLTGSEMQQKVDAKVILKIFKELLPAIMGKADEALNKEVFPLFDSHVLYRSFDNNSYEYNTSVDLELQLLKRGLVQQVGVTISLKGFKKAGIKAFDVLSDLFIYFNDYNFMIGGTRSNPWTTKLYNEMPTNKEIDGLANQFINHLIKQVNQKILEIN